MIARRRAARQASSNTTHRLWLLFVLLVAFGLRCSGLAAQELRGDEAFGYFFSLGSLHEIVEQTLELSEPHPVASYWVQHFWLGAVGHSEFALRFMGVLWSVLAVALTVPLARELALPRSIGRASALLMALSPYAIWHAQDARMYSMSLALTMASTVFTVAWWRAQTPFARVGWACAYIMAAWLALQTHYFALYIILAQHVALLGWSMIERAWRKMVLWWGIGFGLLLLWLPWLLAAREILFDYNGNGDSPPLVDAVIRAHSAFSLGESLPSDVRLLWALITLAVIGAGGIALWRTQLTSGRASLWLLIVYWLIPLAATWISAQNRPIFNERYLVAAVPPVYLLMAAAINLGSSYNGARTRVWLGRVLVAVIVIIMVVGNVRQARDPRLSKTRGWRELAIMLEQLSSGVEDTKMRLAQNYPDPTLWYYYRGSVPHMVLPPASHDEERAVAEVEQTVTGGVNRVILIEQPTDAWDDRGIARASLAHGYDFAGQIGVGNWPLSIWLRPPEVLDVLDVDYAGGLKLVSTHVSPRRLMGGGLIEVYLPWQGGDALLGAQEAVSLQLLNRSGELVAQSDRPLEMASVATAQIQSYVILLPINLTPGDYAVEVVVYDPSREGMPRRATVQGAESVRVGRITIVDTE